MKRILFVLLIALGIAVGISVQAEAGCKIVWSGDLSGEVATNETSRTQQAALEAYNAIQWGETMFNWGSVSPTCSSTGCGWELLGIMQGIREKEIVSTDGSWEHKASDLGCVDGDWCYVLAEGQWDVVCEQTLIQLSSFTAKPKSNEVILAWATESEIDNAGFNIYRSESEDGEYIKINALIPAQGSTTQGATYNFTDENVKNRETYFYKLEDVDLNGTATSHGPVSATPRLLHGLSNQ